MHDVITIGSALVDIFIKSDRFLLKNGTDGVLLCEKYGEKVEIDDFTVCTGGGASNTAVGFSRMGFASAIVAETGKDAWSHVVVEDLHTEKVATNLLISEKREKTGGSVILVGSDGGRTVMVHRGASSQLDAADIPIGKISQAKWVHLSSIAGRIEALESVLAAVKRGHTGLSWNPGKGELGLLRDGRLRITSAPCRVFIVNKEEWQQLDWVQSEVLAHVEQVVVTDGERGGQVYVQGKATPFVSRHVNSVDDTGAGDAFCVGYVSSILYGQKPSEAVVWGVKNALSVVQKIGAKSGLLKKSQL